MTRPNLSAVFTLAALLFGAGVAPGCAPEATEPVAESEDALTTFPFEPGGGRRYDGLEGVRDDALRTRLYELVRNHVSLGYTRARTALFRTGLTASPEIECVYTGRLVTPNGQLNPGGFNTEHSWPQSRGASSEPARSDLHHLFPVDASMNSSRGNNPFGDVTCLHGGSDLCQVESGGSALGRTEKGSIAFEVRNTKRGDIARAQFYFSVRYKRAIPQDTEVTLRRWHQDDPVDAEESLRNDKIEAQQRNRNPFVDRPEFVDQISDF